MESSLTFAICYLQETSSETALCKKFENMDLLSPEQNIYSPDNGSSSENSGSSESTLLGDLRVASFFHVHIKGVLYHSRDIRTSKTI